MSDKQRDPRIDPHPGDEVQQAGSGFLLRVKVVAGDRVSWQRKKLQFWFDDNEWSISGWRDIVAKGAKIIHVAEIGDNHA